MYKANIKTQTEIELFKLLADKVDSIVEQKDAFDIDFENAPGEFKGKNVHSLKPQVIFGHFGI